jgi:hypothetical protein
MLTLRKLPAFDRIRPGVGYLLLFAAAFASTWYVTRGHGAGIPVIAQAGMPATLRPAISAADLPVLGTGVAAAAAPGSANVPAAINSSPAAAEATLPASQYVDYGANGAPRPYEETVASIGNAGMSDDSAAGRIAAVNRLKELALSHGDPKGLAKEAIRMMTQDADPAARQNALAAYREVSAKKESGS